jgi:carbon-monoxide dehydrogenase medium subunit
VSPPSSSGESPATRDVELKPPPLEHIAPTSVEQAVAVLAENGDEAKVLAGGQSLMPLLAFRLARPALLVDVNRLRGELDGCSVTGGEVRIGALARQREVERAGALPLLGEALALVGHPAIRNRGTVVGSVCHADPAAELCAVALALDGVLELRSVRGTRDVAVDDLLVGPFMTVIEPDELATALRLRPPEGWRWTVQELSRRAGDFAITGVVAGVDAGGAQGRLAVFGAAPRAYRVEGPVSELVERAVATAAPVSDLHADAGYRRHLVGVVAGRALAALTGAAA